MINNLKGKSHYKGKTRRQTSAQMILEALESIISERNLITEQIQEVKRKICGFPLHRSMYRITVTAVKFGIAYQVWFVRRQ